VSEVTWLASEIRASVPDVLAAWQDARGADEDFNPHLVEGVGQLQVVFTELLQSPVPLEGFSGEGAIRAPVEDISGHQHEAGRDAVGVIEDYAALRRCV
jgi:hypothetical protein